MPLIRQKHQLGRIEKMHRIVHFFHNLIRRNPGAHPRLLKSPYLHLEYFGHTIDLVDKGEIRFGPAYFDLLIDNSWIHDRTFGKNIWTLDDYLLGAEEWLTTSERSGPLTRLVIFDIQRMRCSTMQRIHGFVESVRIDSTKLIYVRKELSRSEEVEVNLAKISNWTPIFGSNW